MDAAILHEWFRYENGRLYWKKCKAKWIDLKKEAGTINSIGYRTVVFNQKRYAVHRLVYMMHNGYLPKQIDHINGNRADNRIENLREVSNSQNRCNTGLMKSNTSGVKGVCWDKKSNKWSASVQYQNKRVRALFDTLDDAKKFCVAKRGQVHSQYARHG